MPETIYSNPDAFFLEIGGMDFKINEPIGWNKVEISITRDTEKHGVSVTFPDKDGTLEFDNTPERDTGNRSKDLIDAEYNLNGQDAEVIIKFGEFDGVTFTEITRQKIDFSKKYESKLHISIATTTILTLEKRIKDYYDAPINLGNPVDVLGEAIPFPSPLLPDDINMHSQVLIKNFFKKGSGTDITDFSGLPAPNPAFDTFVQFGFPEVVFDTDAIEDFNLPDGVSYEDPVPLLRANFRAKEGGRLIINSMLAISDLTKTVQGGFSEDYTTEMFVVIVSAIDGKTRSFSLGTINATATESGGSAEWTFGQGVNDTIIDYVQPGDFIILYSILLDGSFTITNLDPSSSNFIDISFETYKSASVNESYRLKDAITYAVRAVTGGEDHFKSDIFMKEDTSPVAPELKEHGPGWEFFIMNGFQSRLINDFWRKPIFTLKEAFESLNMMFGMGESIEIDDNNFITIVWEEVEHFYQDHEIIFLQNRIGEFSRLSNKELSVNTVKYQYPKVSVRETQGGGSFQAVNTEIQSSLPIETANKRFNRKSAWRTEGYDIETSRRTSVLDQESIKTDDDIFFISNTDEETEFQLNVSFDEETSKMTFNTDVSFAFMRRFSRLTISGTASNNIQVTYDILSNQEVGSGFSITVNEGLTDEGLILATFTATGTRSRQDEGFVTTEFVDFDEFGTEISRQEKTDLYNMIIQPMRVLMQHSKWTNAMAWFKAKTNKYITLKYLNANNFRTKLNALTFNKYGDTNNIDVLPTDNVAIQDAYQGKSLVNADILKFTAEISRADFILIRDAMRGQGPTPYGFISTLDNDGNKVSGYLLDLSGNPNMNQYDIELMEKGDFYG